jgi:hypothetical protein
MAREFCEVAARISVEKGTQMRANRRDYRRRRQIRTEN